MISFTDQDVLVQGVHPDRAPPPCSARGCSRDAAYSARLHVDSPTEYALTSCGGHLPDMLEAALHAAAGQGEDQ